MRVTLHRAVIFETQQSPNLKNSYLGYTMSTGPAVKQWTVEGIYLDASSDLKKAEIVVANPCLP